MNAGTSDCYSVFCASITYHSSQPHEDFVPWNQRVTNFDSLHNYLQKTYHEHYFNTLFGAPDERQIVHETHQELLVKPFAFQLDADTNHRFQISWLDRYLFANGLALFCFKVEPQPGEASSAEAVSLLIRQFRNPACSLRLADGSTTPLAQVILEYLTPGLTLPKTWDRHFNRLKHYTVVNDRAEKTITTQAEQTLFELAHAMPLGAVGAQSNESPTEEYYQKVFREQSIEVYANWKAIALLDSFTRLSVQFDDVYKSWELDYFHIYVYCLFCKYRLYQFNDAFAAATKDPRQAASLKTAFTSFTAEFVPATISYKFLPNLIFEKMCTAMEIEKDIDAMEKKMARLSTAAKEELSEARETTKAKVGSSIIPTFHYDVFISHLPRDNAKGWVSQFAANLHDELSSLIKEPVTLRLLSGKDEKDRLDDQSGHLNSMVFIPILSPGYCNPVVDEWRSELMTFKQTAESGPYSLDVKLRDGNFASRILPVCIYELEEEDKALYQRDIGRPLRSIDFIYREPGVNRPLKPDDPSPEGAYKISYRNQLNKVANAIKEVILSMKKLSASRP